MFLSQHLMFGGHSLGCTLSGVEAGPVEVDDATLVVPRNWKEPRAWSADSPRTLFPWWSISWMLPWSPEPEHTVEIGKHVSVELSLGFTVSGFLLLLLSFLRSGIYVTSHKANHLKYVIEWWASQPVYAAVSKRPCLRQNGRWGPTLKAVLWSPYMPWHAWAHIHTHGHPHMYSIHMLTHNIPHLPTHTEPHSHSLSQGYHHCFFCLSEFSKSTEHTYRTTPYPVLCFWLLLLGTM